MIVATTLVDPDTIITLQDPTLVVTLTSSALNYGDEPVPQPTTTTPVAAGVGPATIKNAAGFLYGVVVTTSGPAEVLLQDGGPTGTVIAVIPPSHPIGNVALLPGGSPFGISLYAGTGTGSPAFTLLYS